MNDFPFNNVHCKGDEIAKPTIQIAVHVFILRTELDRNWQNYAF